MHQDAVLPLSSLSAGASGRVTHVVGDLTGRAERLAALGVTPGAALRVLQTFPVIVFECDETEMAIEHAMAESVMVEVSRQSPVASKAAE